MERARFFVVIGCCHWIARAVNLVRPRCRVPMQAGRSDQTARSFYLQRKLPDDQAFWHDVTTEYGRFTSPLTSNATMKLTVVGTVLFSELWSWHRQKRLHWQNCNHVVVIRDIHVKTLTGSTAQIQKPVHSRDANQVHCCPAFLSERWKKYLPQYMN
jgi:hypothetical protein